MIKTGSGQLNGGDGDDTLTGLNGDDVLYGFGGADKLTGAGGNDVISGHAGNDTLSGGAGFDYLTGGDGDDLIDGGADTDWASYEGAKAVTVNLNLTGVQDTLGAGKDKLVSIENLYGSDFADHLTGNALDNNLNGAKGDDVLAGGAGNDVLAGGVGDDVLTGGVGNDQILGGDGRDWASYEGATSAVSVDLNLKGAQNTGGGGGRHPVADREPARHGLQRYAPGRRRRQRAGRRQGPGHPDRRRGATTPTSWAEPPASSRRPTAGSTPCRPAASAAGCWGPISRTSPSSARTRPWAGATT